VYGDFSATLYNDELSDLHSSPNIVRVIKSRRMRLVGHVARMEERRGEAYTGFWWGNLVERDHLGDPGVDGKIILILNFREWDGGMYWIELAQDRDSWRALVGAVLKFHKMRGIS
jgi:hypothetical protein